jgi:hypothetical protein
MTRSSTAVLSAAAAAAAAVAAAGAGNDEGEAGAAAQPLPLRSLVLSTAAGRRRIAACSIRLLPSLAAACPQLTQLQLGGDMMETTELATAFTALPRLQDLSLETRYFSTGAMTVPELRLGSQITKLRLSGLELSAEAFSSLPPSLADLEYHPFGHDVLPAAGHLTALTRLWCNAVAAHSNVRPSVEDLRLVSCDNSTPLQHLTRLRSLRFLRTDCTLEQLQAAVTAIGPSLTALDVWAVGDLGRALLSQRVSNPSLPLTGLNAGRYYDNMQTSVAHLGQWTGLTRLSLVYVEPTETPQQLAQQLQQLTALHKLALQYVYLVQPRPSLQPLVDGIVGMSSLRDLSFSWCASDAQQRAQLQGMTQLTRLDTYYYA